VPIAELALLSTKLIKDAAPGLYKGMPLKHEVNAESLTFIKA